MAKDILAASIAGGARSAIDSAPLIAGAFFRWDAACVIAGQIGWWLIRGFILERRLRSIVRKR